VFVLPFTDESFDVVYLSHVLEHLDYPLDALKEIRRVCKGIAVVRVPNELYTNSFLNNECPREHLYCWTACTLKQLLEKVFPLVQIKAVHTIAKRTETNWIERKLKTLKTYVIALFFYRNIDNEIVAVCRT
jgi:ubiquinone/menaquinone biosynthesis C-methylase UbiE